MKFGVREICDVVLKAKAPIKIGSRQFYTNEPVIYFDSLKTSSMEGAATTVYAQGGKGNSRLIAWEGERTVTFTMEDALISPAGFMILSGAGLIEAGVDNKTVIQHMTETIEVTNTDGRIFVSKKPYVNGEDNLIYVMILDDKGNVSTEPYLFGCGEDTEEVEGLGYEIILKSKVYNENTADVLDDTVDYIPDKNIKAFAGKVVLVDYYVERKSGAQQIEIEAGKFGGNYYLEASTLFKNTAGVDMPAEFIIPNCKIQSNFNFTMASSGDPSTFTFTMDAFPDYTRFDRKKKVLAAIQIITSSDDEEQDFRTATAAHK